jgi:hypothetical protein
MTMRTIPVELGKLSGFTCAWPPEPLMEYESTEQRKDRDSDLPLYVVGVNVRFAGTREAYALTIQVPGLPVGLVESQSVKVYDLTASPWDRDGRSGITYRASAITPANAPAPTPVPAASAAPQAPAAGRASGRGAGS